MEQNLDSVRKEERVVEDGYVNWQSVSATPIIHLFIHSFKQHHCESADSLCLENSCPELDSSPPGAYGTATFA